MILAVLVGDDWRFVDPSSDVVGTVEEVFESLAEQVEPGFPSQIAELTFARQPWRGHDVDTDNHLLLSVNQETGFGALTWYVEEGWPREGDIYNEVWVTHNSEPLDFDPRVVSDPDCGTYYHARSAIPLAEIRSALEEFCSTGTGDRPECVSWVPGRIDGRRLDVADPEVEQPQSAWTLPENPWAGL